MSRIVLSDWYELVEGDELMQGDIIESCPVFRPPVDLAFPLPAQTTFDIATQDAVILSQSCDIVKDQKTDVFQVILCPMWALSAAAESTEHLRTTKGKEDCRRGNLHGYHMIDECKDERWVREIQIISFREIISLPLGFIRTVAASKGPRGRLCSPYREHLGQAFARYFMRVGLPSDIPPFR
jgi:hypothetical protein